MFTCQRRVFLKDVDQTGTIYFASAFHYALEAFELFLYHHKTSLSEFFAKGYLFPIVHAEADYTAPLKMGDEISITLRVKLISARSVTIETEMKSTFDGSLVARVTLIHAFIRKGEEKSSKIPEDILLFLNKVMQ